MIDKWAWRVAACCFVLAWPQILSAQDQKGMSPEAYQYLTHALDLMQERALTRATVDWETVRAEAFRMAGEARTTADTYPALFVALAALKDGHSRFIPPLSALPPELQAIAAASRPEGPEGRRVSASLGYIRIPGFSGPNPAEFARQIGRLISEIDDPAVCGWIVDLRGNTGGNMWPMLAGVSAILGEGVPGYFVPPTGARTAWRIDTGMAGSKPLDHRQSPVAVLHDSATASSGEAVVVAFRGRPGTRSFGQSTAGLSTANETIELSDGATILLTVSVFADRNGNLYGGSVHPDERLPAGASDRQVLSAAEKWLLRQSTCAGPVDPGFGGP